MKNTTKYDRFAFEISMMSYILEPKYYFRFGGHVAINLHFRTCRVFLQAPRGRTM